MVLTNPASSIDANKKGKEGKKEKGRAAELKKPAAIALKGKKKGGAERNRLACPLTCFSLKKGGRESKV